MELSLNMYLTTAIAVIVYYMGMFIKNKVEFLQKYCIPAPVVGGIIFSVLILILHETNILIVNMDTTLQEAFMLTFFCSIGFNARMKMLKKGGIQLVFIVVLIAVLCTLQNVMGAAIVKAMGQPALLGVAIGSVPMVGGHGTAAAFGPLIEKMGVPSAATASYAAATFGLIAGCMIGGPIARIRILQLQKKAVSKPIESEEESFINEKPKNILSGEKIMLAVALLLLCVGFGTIISGLIGKLMTFSAAVGSLLAGCILRNICDAKGIKLPDEEIEITGDVSLSIFLSMAMMSMQLWLLADLALPMIITLLAMTVLTGIFAYTIVFWVMGRDYDAAVMASGVCGFGMGATPNAIANMNAVCSKYGPAARAFLVIPIAGSMFADVVNSTIITLFMNFLG